MRDGKGRAGGGADFRRERPHHPGLQEHTEFLAVAGVAPARSPLPALPRLVAPPFRPPPEPKRLQDGGDCSIPAAEVEQGKLVSGRGGGGRAAPEGDRRRGRDGDLVGGRRSGCGVPLPDICVRGASEERAVLPVVGAGIGRFEVRFRSDAVVKD